MVQGHSPELAVLGEIVEAYDVACLEQLLHDVAADEARRTGYQDLHAPATLRVSVPVTKLAKWKTTAQLVAIGFLLAGEAGDQVIPFTTQIGLALLWISAIVILIGAELNAEIEHQTARDSMVGSEKPLGSRGAVMADTVGAARSA